jgi:hypothetical protein
MAADGLYDVICDDGLPGDIEVRRDSWFDKFVLKQDRKQSSGSA